MKLNFFKAPKNWGSPQNFLLPPIFKFIGLFILLASCVLGWLTRYGDIAYLQAHQAIILFHLKNIAILGLLFMVYSQNKDESGTYGDLRAIASNIFILYTVFKVAFLPELNYLMKDPIETIDATLMVVLGLI